MTDSNVTHGETVSKGIFNSNIKYDFAFSQMGQEFQWSCWFACSQMLYQWAQETGIDGYSPDKVEGLLIERAFGTADDLKNAKINGLDKSDFQKVQGALGFMAIDRSTAAAWDGKALVDILDQVGPMLWCSRKDDTENNKVNYHAMIIHGFDTSTNNLNVIDPFDTDHFSTPPAAVGAPYPARSNTAWSLTLFKGSLPNDGSVAAGTALMAVGKPQKKS